MKNILIIILLVCTGIGVLSAQEPSWAVNPSSFSNSMVMVGKIKIDGVESADENDIIAAFINGEVRGVTKPQKESTSDTYTAYLIIYGETNNAEITFKVYDADKDIELEAYNVANFKVNDLIGNLASPYIWSNIVLKEESDLQSFSFTEAIVPATINGNMVEVLVEHNTDITLLTAEFSISPGATAWVNGIAQSSGQTINSFSDTLVYKVISEDGQNAQSYNVIVMVAEPLGIDDNDLFYQLKVFPNPVAETLNINSNYSFEKVLNITDMAGVSQEVKISDHQVDVSNLLPGTYIVEMMVNGTLKHARVVKK